MKPSLANDYRNYMHTESKSSLYGVSEEYSAYLQMTIDKVAHWMVNSDAKKCAHADDPSSTATEITDRHIYSTKDVENRRNQLAGVLASDAMRRLRRRMQSKNPLHFQVNNHHNDRKNGKRRMFDNANDNDSSASSQSSEASSQSSDDDKKAVMKSDSHNRNRNNKHNAVDSKRQNRDRHNSEVKHKPQTQSKPKTTRKETGDNDLKEDRYLERIIARATDEIRTAVYKLKAEDKLPDSCHLKMKLSIKPQKPKANKREEESDKEEDAPPASRDRKKKEQAVAAESTRQKSSTSRQNRHDKNRVQSPEHNRHEHKASRRK